MTAPEYRLRALGGLSLERHGASPRTVLVQGRRLGMLALLATSAPAGVRREILTTYLWPESDADRARNALNQAVFALRRELGEGAITVTGGEVRLSTEHVTIDVVEFEKALSAGELDRSIELYGGPFVAGFFLPDAGEFERWVESERARLARRYIDALSRHAGDAEAAGDWARAVESWRRAINAEPLSARLVVRLMRALAAAGDRSAAVQTARTYTDLARRELDIDPDPAVLATEAELRNGNGTAGRVLAGAASTPPSAVSLGTTSAHAEVATLGEPSANASPDSTVAQVPSVRRPRPAYAMIAGAMTFLTLAFVGVYAWRHKTTDEVHPVLASTRILIAPFQNATGDSTLDYLGIMASDGVASSIARTGFIDVVDWRRLLTEIAPDTAGGNERSRVATLAHADSAAGAAGVAELARETGAGAVVWGRVYRVADSVRFETWILRGDARRVVRILEPVSTSLASPAAGLDQLRRNVTGAFAALADSRLAAWSGAATHTPPYDAYVQYVRGIEAMARRRTDLSAVYFERAVAADSNFAEAMLWLTESLQVTPGGRLRADSLIKVLDTRRDQLAPYDQAVLDTKIGWSSSDREMMYRASVRMTQLAPGSNDAHWAHGSTAVMTNRFSEASEAFARVDLTRGWMKDWDYYLRWPSLARHARAEYGLELAEIRQHRRRFPTSSDLCLLELRPLAAMGRLDEIPRVSAECNALPTAVEMQTALTFHFIAKELRTHGWGDAARAYADSAVAAFRARSEREPKNIGWRQGMAMSYLEGGRWPEARALYEQLNTTSPTPLPGILTSIGVAAARAGDDSAANALLRRVAVDTTMRPSWIALFKARIAASMGREQEGLDFLREAVRQGFVPMEVVHYDVGLERLHTTSGWAEIMKERR